MTGAGVLYAARYVRPTMGAGAHNDFHRASWNSKSSQDWKKTHVCFWNTAVYLWTSPGLWMCVTHNNLHNDRYFCMFLSNVHVYFTIQVGKFLTVDGKWQPPASCASNFQASLWAMTINDLVVLVDALWRGWKITVVYARFFGLCAGGRYTTTTVTGDCEKTYSWNPYQPWSEKGLCPWLIHSSSLGSTAGRWNPLVFPLKRWWFRRLNFSVVCQPTKWQFPESITYQIVATAGPKLRPCSFICRIICIMSCNCLSFSHAHLCLPQVPMIFQNIVPKDQGRFDYNFLPMWLKDFTRNQINHLFVGGNAFEVSESLMMLQNMYRLPKGGGSKGEGSNWEPGWVC